MFNDLLSHLMRDREREREMRDEEEGGRGGKGKRARRKKNQSSLILNSMIFFAKPWGLLYTNGPTFSSFQPGKIGQGETVFDVPAS